MRPAIEFSYSKSRRYRDEAIEKSAKAFAIEAVNFSIEKILVITDLNDKVKHEVINQLKSMRIIFGFPEEISEPKKIEEFYVELKLNGTESYIETCREIHKHHQKLENEPKKSWRRKLDEMSTKTEVEYFTNDNVLCELRQALS
jgi:recombinational DNA repair protein RecT